jgi:hypothetical protein
MNEISTDNNENTFIFKSLLPEELIEEEIDDNLNETFFEKIKNDDDNYTEHSDNENIEKNTKNQYKCTFTNILNIQKENKINKEYNSWLNKNYNELQSAFYIINKNYFDKVKLNREINFKEFTEFCFFSN